MKASRKSVAHVHWAFPPTIGGVETHMSILLPELVRGGHRQWALTASIQGRPDRETWKGVQVVRTPQMDLDRILKKDPEVREENVREAFRAFFEAAKPDIIHAHNMHYFSPMHAYALREEAKRITCPLVLTAHNVWDDSLYLNLTVKIGWDHIIAVSHFIEREIAGSGYDADRITVVYHGIDAEKFKVRGDIEGL